MRANNTVTGRGTLLIESELSDSTTVLLENVVHIEGSVHVGYFSSRYECPDVAPRFTSIELPKLETIGRDLVIGCTVFGDETPCFCLESPEDDWRCAVRYSDDDCTPDSDDECGDEDRRI